MIQITRLPTPRAAQSGADFRAMIYRSDGDGALADPFLYVAHFAMTGPTFGPHPHAGFSAITYLFPDSQTGFRNRDSLGNDEEIAPGALHWTCAGAGILHDEEPLEPGRIAHGLQIFLNLPEHEQLNPPSILRIGAHAVERVPIEQGEARLLDAARIAAPQELKIWDLSLAGETTVPIPAGWGGLVMVLEGEAAVGVAPGITVTAPDAAVLRVGPVEGGQLALSAEKPAHIVVLASAALDQPVHWYGPFAMARTEEIEGRIRAYRTGMMGRLEALGGRGAI